MKDFVFFFRAPGYDPSAASPAELQALLERWREWIGGIEAEDKLVSHGNRLSKEGRVLKSGGVVTDGPFVETREILGGFIVVRAADLDEATTLAHGCPALTVGGSVEIRPLL